ncbi:MAG TPA: accessory factor UbiK family protein [Gammaproteobacteria bacterium]|nr:accessory factor UbiK family protein [Gammaproteobacteria bacterium]
MVNNSIEQLAKQLSDRISALLPGDAGGIKKELEASIHSLLQSTFSKMNLVSREEFDVQTAVLQRTREKLEQLEKQLEKLKENSS